MKFSLLKSLLTIGVISSLAAPLAAHAQNGCASGVQGPFLFWNDLYSNSLVDVSDNAGAKNGTTVTPGAYRIRYHSGVYTHRHGNAGTWGTLMRIDYYRNGTWLTDYVGSGFYQNSAQAQAASNGSNTIVEVSALPNGGHNLYVYIDDVWTGDNSGSVNYEVYEACIGQCNDDFDNDGDGLVDQSDPSCWTNPNDPNSYIFSGGTESPSQFGACQNNPVTFASHGGVLSVTVYERSGGAKLIYPFALGGIQLNTDLFQDSQRNDFTPNGLEFYDVFVSDSRGSPNPGGAYVTIDANTAASAPVTEGNNIDAVSLNIAGGQEVFADSVSHVALGSGSPLTSGDAMQSIGPSNGAATNLGKGNSSITVGFCNTLVKQNNPVGPTCTKTSIAGTLLTVNANAQERFVIAQGRRLQRFLKDDRELRYDVRRRIRRAAVTNTKIQKLVVAIPPFITNCAVSGCAGVNNAGTLNQIINYYTRMHRISRNIIGELKKLKVETPAGALKLLKQSEDMLSASTLKLTSTIPGTTNSCS